MVKPTPGTDTCECAVCGLQFNSTAAFDKHRTGNHKKDERVCLTVTQMSEIGMGINTRGRWVTALREE